MKRILNLFLILIGTVLLIYIISGRNLRFDYIWRYSVGLSDYSRSILDQLDKPLTLELCVHDLESPLKEIGIELRSAVVGYWLASRGNIRMKFLSMNSVNSISYRFTSTGTNEFTSGSYGYYGLNIYYNNQDSIIYPTNNFEYIISNYIKHLSVAKHKIAYLHNPEESAVRDFQTVFNLLQHSYVIEDYELNENSDIPLDYKAILIFGPKKTFTKKHIKILDNYLAEGGSMFLEYKSSALYPPSKIEYTNLKEWLIENDIVTINEYASLEKWLIKKGARQGLTNKTPEWIYEDRLKRLDKNPRGKERYLKKGIDSINAYPLIREMLHKKGMNSIYEYSAIKEWLREKGIDISDQFIVDKICFNISVGNKEEDGLKESRQMPLLFLPIITNYSDHPLTRGLDSILLLSNPINYHVDDNAIDIIPLAFSSDMSGLIDKSSLLTSLNDNTYSGAEENLELSDQVVAVAVEKLERDSIYSQMIIVSNNSSAVLTNDQINDVYWRYPDNVQFTSNSIEWLANDNIIDIDLTLGSTIETTNYNLLLKHVDLILFIVIILAIIVLNSFLPSKIRIRYLEPGIKLKRGVPFEAVMGGDYTVGICLNKVQLSTKYSGIPLGVSEDIIIARIYSSILYPKGTRDNTFLVDTITRTISTEEFRKEATDIINANLERGEKRAISKLERRIMRLAIRYDYIENVDSKTPG